MSDGDGASSPSDSESDADLGLDPVVDDAEAAAADGDFPADPERVAFLRDIADDVRGESGESRQLAAILYRVSDLYDPEEETSPVEIYRNVEHIMEIKAQGGIDR
ncbi:hypothetical protein [Salinirubrum litoreum]|uniref:Uncharacterized protein n=1 Tax=Salinirubrum litoreum TaxID=1126234 RepID=A0ABD5R7N2_9EURY